jgi:hypothetical protein
MSSRPADLCGIRSLRSSKSSKSEIGAEDRNLEDDEMEGRTLGHGLLYYD